MRWQPGMIRGGIGRRAHLDMRLRRVRRAARLLVTLFDGLLCLTRDGGGWVTAATVTAKTATTATATATATATEVTAALVTATATVVAVAAAASVTLAAA